MRRGETWTAADPSSDHAGKPGPVLVLQDDAFAATGSMVVPFTTDPNVAPLLRLPVAPDPASNGLSKPCSLMAEKVAAVRRGRLGGLVGRLDDRRMVALGALVATALGLARPMGGGGRGSSRVGGPASAGGGDAH